MNLHSFNYFISRDVLFNRKKQISWPQVLVFIHGSLVSRDIVQTSSGYTYFFVVMRLFNKSTKRVNTCLTLCRVLDHRDKDTHIIDGEEDLREMKQLAQGHQASKGQSWTLVLFLCHKFFTKQPWLLLKNTTYMNANWNWCMLFFLSRVLLPSTLSFFLSYPCITITLSTIF